jgi:hypothetical protein
MEGGEKGFFRYPSALQSRTASWMTCSLEPEISTTGMWLYFGSDLKILQASGPGRSGRLMSSRVRSGPHSSSAAAPAPMDSSARASWPADSKERFRSEQRNSLSSMIRIFTRRGALR